MNKQYVAICEKVALTIEEAAEYSNIGQNRISSLLKEPRCPFVLFGKLNAAVSIRLKRVFQST